MAAGTGQEDTMKQAEHIWAMLDDLAANDPDAYQKFIDKNLRESKEEMNPPQPHMCVQTKITETASGRKDVNVLYINVMAWHRLPAPKGETDPVPTTSSSIYKPSANHEDVGGDDYKLVTVVFNPTVLSQYGADSKNTQERHLLICLAIDFLIDQFHCDISKNYHLIPVKTRRCMGSVDEAALALTRKFSSTTRPPMPENMSKTFEKFAQFSNSSRTSSNSTNEKASFNDINSPSSLLQQLSLVGQHKQDDNGDITISGRVPISGITVGTSSSSSTSSSSCRPGALIEELCSTRTELATPEYSIKRIERDNSGSLDVVIEIRLPGVTSIKDCQLDMSEDDVYLLVRDKYELTIDLKSMKVAHEECSAKFSKRSNSLLLTLPTYDTES